MVFVNWEVKGPRRRECLTKKKKKGKRGTKRRRQRAQGCSAGKGQGHRLAQRGQEPAQGHTEGFGLKAETGAHVCPRRLRAAPPPTSPAKPQSLDSARMVLGSLDSSSHGWGPDSALSLPPCVPPHLRGLFSSNLLQWEGEG